MFRVLFVFLLGVSSAFAQSTLDAPTVTQIGSAIEITVTGPTEARDFLTIVPKSAREGAYDAYVYAPEPGVFQLTAPAEPGEYEIRLLGAKPPYRTLARRNLKVEAIAVTLEAPAQVAAGAEFDVKWSGPGNKNDYVGIGTLDPAKEPYITYAYTSTGNPVSLRAPDAAGDYEVRYFLSQGDKIVASRRITVGGVSASVSAPASVTAGSAIEVTWKGPDNRNDYINLVPKGAREGESGLYAYTATGNPAKIRAPLAPGEYELRYSTGQSHVTLARAPIRITPGTQEPGLVWVSALSALPPDSAVEIILDASGSMLQRIGGQRRIDIAKQTLTRLTSTTIPAGTPFALRVFGREVDSCQTDLEIPLGALNASAVSAKIAKLEAKNNAKTPIGASLQSVARDLSAVKGERLVILLTDGEETCGGDPAAAIAELKQAGISTRINIVGFAIDDATLATTFKQWAETGGGTYFDAKDAAGLDRALSQAMQSGFEILNAQGQVVADGLAGGEPVRVMPGTYNVRIKGRTASARPITVRSKETTSVSFQ